MKEKKEKKTEKKHKKESKHKKEKKHKKDSIHKYVKPEKQISSDDYFLYNSEFRVWLVLGSRPHFEDLNSSTSHDLFKKVHDDNTKNY